jgi:hypothetical protein
VSTKLKSRIFIIMRDKIITPGNHPIGLGDGDQKKPGKKSTIPIKTYGGSGGDVGKKADRQR